MGIIKDDDVDDYIDAVELGMSLAWYRKKYGIKKTLSDEDEDDLSQEEIDEIFFE